MSDFIHGFISCFIIIFGPAILNSFYFRKKAHYKCENCEAYFCDGMACYHLRKKYD